MVKIKVLFFVVSLSPASLVLSTPLSAHPEEDEETSFSILHRPLSSKLSVEEELAEAYRQLEEKENEVSEAFFLLLERTDPFVDTGLSRGPNEDDVYLCSLLCQQQHRLTERRSTFKYLEELLNYGS